MRLDEGLEGLDGTTRRELEEGSRVVVRLKICHPNLETVTLLLLL
jgi:hypothetical protein